jgi:hypothetical protein
MSYVWYNNGLKNEKVFEGKKPKPGFKKGYIIIKNKSVRLNKLNKRYEKLISDLLEKTKQKTEKKIKQLEEKLIEEQKKIYPDS